MGCSLLSCVSTVMCPCSVLQGRVYRFCTAEGLWLHKDNSSLPWRDLSECEESKRGERVSWRVLSLGKEQLGLCFMGAETLGFGWGWLLSHHLSSSSPVSSHPLLLGDSVHLLSGQR